MSTSNNASNAGEVAELHRIIGSLLAENTALKRQVDHLGQQVTVPATNEVDMSEDEAIAGNSENSAEANDAKEHAEAEEEQNDIGDEISKLKPFLQNLAKAEEALLDSLTLEMAGLAEHHGLVVALMKAEVNDVIDGLDVRLLTIRDRKKLQEILRRLDRGGGPEKRVEAVNTNVKELMVSFYTKRMQLQGDYGINMFGKAKRKDGYFDLEGPKGDRRKRDL
jgi:hypothetical protein